MTPPPVVDEAEVEITAVRAQGAGGQNVNKVSSAIHLRFDVAASSLPDEVKARLLGRADGGAVLSIDEVADAVGTVGYELMCARAPRVPIVAA